MAHAQNTWQGRLRLHDHYEARRCGRVDHHRHKPHNPPQRRGHHQDFDPAELGFERAPLADLQGGEAQTNAAIARALLSGELTGPKRDVVLLNAAAALSLDTGDFQAGLQTARESLDSGAALQCLDRYITKTRSYTPDA